MSFASKIFSIDTVKMGDRSEQIVKGGRHLFPLSPLRRERMGLRPAQVSARKGLVRRVP